MEASQVNFDSASEPILRSWRFAALRQLGRMGITIVVSERV